MKNADKTIKRQLRRFYPEDFPLEVQELNELSRQGWQLKTRRMFTRKLHKDDSVCYRYAIDHHADFSGAQFEEYKALLREQGWEYVTYTQNWFFLRKAFDPALPEEEYLFYTDAPSFRDMTHRAAAGIGFIHVYLLLRLLLNPSILYLSMLLFFQSLSLIDYARRKWLQKIDPLAPPLSHAKARRLLRLSTLPFFILFLIYMFSYSANSRDPLTAGPLPAGEIVQEFSVSVPDFYCLNILAYPEERGTPVTAALFRTDGTPMAEDLDINGDLGPGNTIFLMPGDYRLTFACEEDISVLTRVDYPDTVGYLLAADKEDR